MARRKALISYHYIETSSQKTIRKNADRDGLPLGHPYPPGSEGGIPLAPQCPHGYCYF